MKRIVFFQLFLVTISTLFAQETDSIIDIRDSQVYKVVKIGQQWWMKENLDIGIRIDGIQDASDNGIIEKYFYNNSDSLGNIYGGIYLWDEMMDYNPSDSMNPGITQGISPVGWHLPSNDEWTEMIDFLGGEDIAGGKLKEAGTKHWKSPNTSASNESGFTALPGGCLFTNGTFGNVSSRGYWWSSTENNNTDAGYGVLFYSATNIYRTFGPDKFGSSVRCVMDSCQFGYLTISDKNLKTISKMEFRDDRTIDTIVIINSNAGNTINISSIHTKTSLYSVNKSSSVLSPGDSIHLNVTFHPPAGGIQYQDTLLIESDDPYNPIIYVPLDGNIKIDKIIDFRDSQIYKVVKIGQQWWMQENLNIGTRIDGSQDGTDNGMIEKYCYDNDIANCDTLGGLYQWNEMMDYNPSDAENPGTTRGVCPVGWHVPTDNEWTELTDFLGGESIAGGKMKETGTNHWREPNAGATNESCFTALPGGDGSFSHIHNYGYWWSSTEYYADSWHRYMYYNSPLIYRNSIQKKDGFSVRCVMDSCQFGNLTISDKNLKSITELEFSDDRTINTIVIINSGANETINISSFHNTNPAYDLDKSSCSLSPGDSISLTITLNPRLGETHFIDTLHIESDDPYRPAISVPLNGYMKPDSIIDIRDGQVYNIVKIGSQWWMQENLNIGIRIDGSQDAEDNGIIEKYCYDDNPDNCETYGGLYRWNEMMDYYPSDIGNPGITQGVCPVGWRLPTDSEWTDLTDFLGGESVAGGKLKETGIIHWNSPNTGATNESGFSALPGGFYGHKGSSFSFLGLYANFWSSTGTESDSAYFYNLSSGSSVLNSGMDSIVRGFSVRCLRDSSQFSYLTISDTNLNQVQTLLWYGNASEELVAINSSTSDTISISSIFTNNPVYSLNKSSSILMAGDSIHFTITYNPTVKNIYLDTLFIQSDDPYQKMITIPLNGTFLPEVTFTDSTNISCFGFSDGSATVTPSLGTPPYQYQWNDPGNTTDSIVTGLLANKYYHITVTDNLGWSIEDSIQLSQPDQLEINPFYSDTICLNSSDGYIGTNPSGGTPPYYYTWSNDSTGQSITDLEPGNYDVNVTDIHGCEDSAFFNIRSAIPFDGEKICIVTIDILTGHNMVIWEKTPNKGTGSYNIYREDELIGSVPYENLSIFKDTTADPESRPFLYSISVIDTCGNESDQSPYHKPLFLQYVSSIDGVNLRWSKYEMENGDLTFDSYEIWRGGDSINLTPFAENIPTAVDIYTDNDPTALEKKYYYRVAGILEIPCEPSGDKKAGTGPYRHSLSNMDNNKLKDPGDTTGIYGYSPAVRDLQIFPNPFSDYTTVLFSNNEQAEYRMNLYDMMGRKVVMKEGIREDQFQIHRRQLNPGYYRLELTGPKLFRGTLAVK